MFLEKVVLKIRSKFTGELTCRSAISITLLCNFIEITLQHGCSLVNLGVFLYFQNTYCKEHLWEAGGLFLEKGISESMQQIYRKIPMTECDFKKVVKQLY